MFTVAIVLSEVLFVGQEYRNGKTTMLTALDQNSTEFGKNAT